MHWEAMILHCDYYCLGGRRGHSFWEEVEAGAGEDWGRGGETHRLVPAYENSSCER